MFVFFQAEDGIRDYKVTGVQTCALPICSVTLLVKGIFLLRKSSEGLGLTPSELADLSDPSNCKTLPSVPNQAAQIVQDFGAGSLLLWPLLNVGQDIDHSWSNPPRVTVFLSGAILFFLGWFIRRLTSIPGHQ